MLVERDSDFLKRCVREVNETLEIRQTYGDNVDNDGSERGGTDKNTSKTVEDVGTNVDGSNEFNDDCLGARVIVAVVELGDDGIALVAKVAERIPYVRNGPFRDDLGDSAGEGHSAGSEDSEDGRETHDEED